MSTEYVLIEQSPQLNGTVSLVGAKNAVLVIMASLLLAPGKSRLTNVPFSDDITHMIKLLVDLGATVSLEKETNTLEIDTSGVNKYTVSAEIMKKMRASVLVMGPLLARFGKAEIALPGGCIIGSRPIDLHLKGFAKMGASVSCQGEFLNAEAATLVPTRIVLEYPSVGATENIMMAAALTQGRTLIVNAALEPEVLDLVLVLRKMGAEITVMPPAALAIEGVRELKPVDHAIMYDRLEAGSLILAAAITGGEIALPQAPAGSMEVFLSKLDEMGHEVTMGADGVGVWFKATSLPRAVSFKTMPYPGFPTDLQAPMMAALCLASGTSVIHETVFENRLLHTRELQKMGAQITIEGHTATITGVDELYGSQVIATDIRASCALVLAGLVAQGQTVMTGVHHLHRGYEGLVDKLNTLGGRISIKREHTL
jgi:UDP-N-acetylglucosamine 1-carboxyvinyltransferase